MIDFRPGSYYAVRRAHEICVHGPCIRWQDACTGAFGIITTEMTVKCLGHDQFLVKDRTLTEQMLNQPAGWFKPMIIGKTLTMTPEEALGPPEIASWLTQAGKRMDVASNAAEVGAICEDAIPYLRHTPLQYCQKFQDIRENNLRRLSHAARSNGSNASS